MATSNTSNIYSIHDNIWSRRSEVNSYTLEGLLKARIDEIEALIFVYSDRDRIRVEALEQELDCLNMQLLDSMVS